VICWVTRGAYPEASIVLAQNHYYLAIEPICITCDRSVKVIACIEGPVAMPKALRGAGSRKDPDSPEGRSGFGRHRSGAGKAGAAPGAGEKRECLNFRYEKVVALTHGRTATSIAAGLRRSWLRLHGHVAHGDACVPPGGI